MLIRGGQNFTISEHQSDTLIVSGMTGLWSRVQYPALPCSMDISLCATRACQLGPSFVYNFQKVTLKSIIHPSSTVDIILISIGLHVIDQLVFVVGT